MRPRNQAPGQSVLFVVLALAVLAFVTYLAEGPREMNDLEVFHRAGARFIRGESLYRIEDGHFELKYLPVSAALFAPLSLLPLGTAKLVWLAGSWLSLSLAFALAARLLGERLPWWGPLAALLVLARSIEREYAHGQINAVLLLLVVAAFVQLEKRRDICAGALIAVAVLLKPPWLVLLPYLLVAGRWRAATTLAVLALVGNALPALRYGVTGTLALHADMNARLAASTARLLTYPTNVSLPGAIAKLTGGGMSSVVLVALVLLALPCAAFAWRVWKERGNGRVAEDLAIVTPLAILLSPQAWDYTVLTTLPTLLLAATMARRAPWPVRAVTIAVSVVVALDYIVLFGRGPSYEAIMRWSPNTWFLLWMLGVALCGRSGCGPRSLRAARDVLRSRPRAAASQERRARADRNRGAVRGGTRDGDRHRPLSHPDGGSRRQPRQRLYVGQPPGPAQRAGDCPRGRAPEHRRWDGRGVRSLPFAYMRLYAGVPQRFAGFAVFAVTVASMGSYSATVAAADATGARTLLAIAALVAAVTAGVLVVRSRARAEFGARLADEEERGDP